MFSKISWETFLTSAGVLIIIYYVLIGAYFFRKDLQSRISFKRIRHVADYQDTANDLAIADDLTGSGIETEIDDDTFLDIEALTGRLKESIGDAASREYNKAESLQLVRNIYGDYPNLKNTNFRSAINSLVVAECEKYDIVSVTEDEVDEMWV